MLSYMACLLEIKPLNKNDRKKFYHAAYKNSIRSPVTSVERESWFINEQYPTQALRILKRFIYLVFSHNYEILISSQWPYTNAVANEC